MRTLTPKTNKHATAPVGAIPIAPAADSVASMQVATGDASVATADAPVATAGASGSSLTLRLARPDDRVALAELASLDSSRLPAEPVLLAEVAGELCAALSLSEQKLVADPFRPTAGLCDLLRARAEQLGAVRRAPRFRLPSWLRLRLSPAMS